MRRIVKLVTLLTLALALLLAQAAVAEPSDAVKGIYDAMLAEDSSYSQNKAMYVEYYPETEYTETLNDDGFTITVTGNEYADGSWTYTEDGDYLTVTVSAEDFNGAMMVYHVVDAVGRYYGMDIELLGGYVNGLSELVIENDNFIATQNEDGAVTYRINIAGAWDMAELDQMVLNEDVLYFDALTEDYTSAVANIGKVRMVVNGTADDATILLGEYGGLDDVAYQSIINAVSVLQPNGWEDFVANYTELADAEADGYTVALNVDDATIAENVDGGFEGFSVALLHFGA